MAEQVKSGKFSGIPVVFIPGNSGSYKQVRSMASVALRKASCYRILYYSLLSSVLDNLNCINDNMVCVYRKAIDDSEYKTHFDYFSVDFSEEYSAIYGGVLELQADYLRQARVHLMLLKMLIDRFAGPKFILLL